MAGSWGHIVDAQGRLIDPEDFPDMIENLGDAYELAEQCFGMITYLADGDVEKIAEACTHYRTGVALGVQVRR